MSGIKPWSTMCKTVLLVLLWKHPLTPSRRIEALLPGFLFWGHSWPYLRLTSGLVLRDQSWRVFEVG